MMSKCRCDVGDCSHGWGWGLALLPHSLMEIAQGWDYWQLHFRAGKNHTHEVFVRWICYTWGRREERGCGLGWRGAGSRSTRLQDWDCPRWVRSVMMSSQCSSLLSGESPGRGRASQGPSCVWGERGGGFLRGASVLGPGTQQPVAGVAYHLGGDTGAKFNVL